eukprot:13170019-Alexandrium_andersonii.AAC.1
MAGKAGIGSKGRPSLSLLPHPAAHASLPSSVSLPESASASPMTTVRTPSDSTARLMSRPASSG